MVEGADLDPLRLDLEPDRERVIVRPIGEIDLTTVARLDAEVRELRARGFDAIVVDLGGLDFMDSQGLHCIMRLADELGDGLTLRPGPPAVQRLFEVSGMTQALPFEARRRRFMRR